MSYATRQDMIDRFGERELIALTDREGEVGTIVDAVLDRALADADAVIDAHLQSAGYTLPLQVASKLLCNVAVDIARAKLHDENPSETVLSREKGAMRTLEKISSGALKLGMPTASAPASNDTATLDSAGSVWARGKSRDFI